MTTKVHTKAKLIDGTTIFEAAKYITYDIPETHHLKKADIFQEAYIMLSEKRMGKFFHSSVSWTKVELMRKFFGRKNEMSQEAYDKRYVLEHGAFETKPNLTVADPVPTVNFNSSEIYEELKLFAERVGYLDEFYALVNAERFGHDPTSFIAGVRGIKRKTANERFVRFKDKVKSHYDFEFFA